MKWLNWLLTYAGSLACSAQIGLLYALGLVFIGIGLSLATRKRPFVCVHCIQACIIGDHCNENVENWFHKDNIDLFSFNKIMESIWMENSCSILPFVKYNFLKQNRPAGHWHFAAVLWLCLVMRSSSLLSRAGGIVLKFAPVIEKGLQWRSLMNYSHLSSLSTCMLLTLNDRYTLGLPVGTPMMKSDALVNSLDHFPNELSWPPGIIDTQILQPSAKS
mgnify:CR=1 FL=1